MKLQICGWVQKKLNGKPRNNEKIPAWVSAYYHVKQEPAKKEEFSDGPEGFLTIGTFGNNDVPAQNPNIQLVQEEEDHRSSSPDLQDFTQEEVGKLQKELTKLLKLQPSRSIDSKEIIEHPLNKFLNCPSSLEVDRRICESFRTSLTGTEKEEEDLDRAFIVLLGRYKDVCGEKGNNSIGKKSSSFLLKKMFVCTGGFLPGSSSRKSLSESRMEKLLRTMLHKKINPQSSRSSFMKRVLDERHETINMNEYQRRGNVNDGLTWVKTDSEFIVLEI